MTTPKRAGRPLKGGQPRKQINLRLPVEQVNWLKQNGMTETIEKLIGDEMKNQTTLAKEIAHDLAAAGLSPRWCEIARQMVMAGNYETGTPETSDEWYASEISRGWTVGGKRASFTEGENGNDSLRKLVIKE